MKLRSKTLALMAVLILATDANWFWQISSIPHFSCRKLMKSSELGKAFICGVNLHANSRDFQSALTRLGLIHLIVVSGSHLFYLRKGLRALAPILTRLPGLELFFCFFYGAICWWDPPVTRASIQLLVHYMSKKEKLNFTVHQEIFWAGFLTLIIFPHWFSSLSFCLSWLASLGLCIGRKPWHQASLCFFILTPILFPLGGIHPLTIAANIILGPVLGLTLIPISLVHLLNFQEILQFEKFEFFVKNFFIQGAQLIPELNKWTELDNLNFFYIWLYVAGITILTIPSRLMNLK